MNKQNLIAAIIAGNTQQIKEALPERRTLSHDDVEQAFFSLIEQGQYVFHYWEQGGTRKPVKDELEQVLNGVDQFVNHTLKKDNSFHSLDKYIRQISLETIKCILDTNGRKTREHPCSYTYSPHYTEKHEQ